MDIAEHLGASMGAALSIVALLLLLAGGAGCAVMLLQDRDSISPLEVGGLAVVLGSGFVAASSLVVGLVLNGLALQFVVALSCAGMAALGVRRGAGVSWSASRLLFWLIPAGVVAAELVVLVWFSFRYPLGWDSLVIWEFKARVATLNGGALPLEYFLDVTRQWSHPEYPLLFPLTEAWLFDWAGGADERLVRVLFAVLDVAMLSGLYVLGEQLSGSRLNGLLAAALLPFVPQLIIGTGGATSAWTDYFVGLIYLLAGGYLVKAIITRKLRLFAVVGALGATLVWTKQEGAILWLCLVLTTVVFALQRWIWAIVVAAPGLVVLAAWRTLVQVQGVPQLPDFLPITTTTMLANLDRAPVLLGWTAGLMSDTRSWGLLWPAVALSLVVAGWSKLRQQLVLGLLIVAPLVPYALTFVFSASTPYAEHFNSAMPRLMEHVAPLGVLAIACAAPGSMLVGLASKLGLSRAP